MLGQTSQMFAEAEMAYRHNRVIEDYAAAQPARSPRWLARLRRAEGRRPRPAVPTARHAVSH